MSNPQLTAEQRKVIFLPLFGRVKVLLEAASGGDQNLKWALNRKLFKELVYLERGKPMQRKALKKQKMKEHAGICALCRRLIQPDDESHLHRTYAPDGYTPRNTQLVHDRCHRQDQKAKKYA